VYSHSRSILNGFVEPAAKIRKQADAQILRFATLVLSDAARTTLARLIPSYKLPPLELSWISDMDGIADKVEVDRIKLTIA